MNDLGFSLAGIWFLGFETKSLNYVVSKAPSVSDNLRFYDTVV